MTKKIENWFGEKTLCHFCWFQFLGSARSKIGRIQNKLEAKISHAYCVSLRRKLKKGADIALPKNLIFHFLSKTPIWAKNGSPAPQGSKEKIIGMYQEVTQFIFIFISAKKNAVEFFWSAHAGIYVQTSVKQVKFWGASIFEQFDLRKSIYLKRKPCIVANEWSLLIGRISVLRACYIRIVRPDPYGSPCS